MALSPVAFLLNDAVVVSVDLTTTGAVQGVQIDNASASAVTFAVTRAGASVITQTAAPGGSATASIPKGKQFSATTDWTFSISVG